MLLILLSSCASAPDVDLCHSVSPSRCYCNKTISDDPKIIDDEKTLDGQTCADLRANAILMPGISWAKIKAFIIKICKQTNSCNGIQQWESKIDLLDGQ